MRLRAASTIRPPQEDLEDDRDRSRPSLLADEGTTREEIHEGLERRSEEKAETTVCHHVNVLKDGGMVEIPRLEEADGGTRKYYRSNTWVFSYTLPGSSKETFATAQETTTEELSGLIETLYEQHGDDIDSAVREMKPASTVRPDMKSSFSVSRSTYSLLALSETGTLNDLLTGEDDASSDASVFDVSRRNV